MSESDFALLRPHLTLVELPKSQPLIEPDQEIVHSWFMESGIASVVANSRDGHQTEIGIVGREGMVDLGTLLDVDRTQMRSFIQSPGQGYRMPAAALREATDSSPELRRRLLRYAHRFFTQVAHTALANASHALEERLARWLLMCHDRADGDEVAMTHEFLSLMLNVRRAGVTLAVQALENARMVSARRGAITIVDRPALEEFAADCYGPAEQIIPFDRPPPRG